MNVYVTSPMPNEIRQAIKHIGPDYFPHTVNAIRTAVNEAQKTWVKMLLNSQTKSGWKRQYVNSISIDEQKNPLEASVSATGMYVNFVENGVKRYDMKPGLLKNAKHTNEKGEKYAIIFMRKGAEGTQHIPPMPTEVHRQAMQLDFGKSLKDVGTFGMTSEQMAKMTQNEWKSGLYEGLTKLGRKHHEEYGTFRIVTKNSKGWIYPGVPKVPIFSNMTRVMGPRVKEIMQKGIMKDLEEGLNAISKAAGGKR